MNQLMPPTNPGAEYGMLSYADKCIHHVLSVYKTIRTQRKARVDVGHRGQSKYVARPNEANAIRCRRRCQASTRISCKPTARFSYMNISDAAPCRTIAGASETCGSGGSAHGLPCNCKPHLQS